MAISLGARRILLDDAAARSAATAAGLATLGVVGILLAAKTSGLVPSVRQELDSLIAGSFHISPRLYRMAVAQAGE